MLEKEIIRCNNQIYNEIYYKLRQELTDELYEYLYFPIFDDIYKWVFGMSIIGFGLAPFTMTVCFKTEPYIYYMNSLQKSLNPKTKVNQLN
jgi:hypothetical protein